VIHATYCRVDSLGISSSLCGVDSFGISTSLCALDDRNVDETGVDALGLKPVSLGLGLCADRPENQCISLHRLITNISSTTITS